MDPRMLLATINLVTEMEEIFERLATPLDKLDKLLEEIPSLKESTTFMEIMQDRKAASDFINERSGALEEMVNDFEGEVSFDDLVNETFEGLGGFGDDDPGEGTLH